MELEPWRVEAQEAQDRVRLLEAKLSAARETLEEAYYSLGGQGPAEYEVACQTCREAAIEFNEALAD